MYAIPTAFVSALFVVFGLYVLITQGITRLSGPFLLMCAATFAWQGTWTLLFETNDPQLAGVLVRLAYLFILFLPTTFYHFVIEVAARRREQPLLFASYGLDVWRAYHLHRPLADSGHVGRPRAARAAEELAALALRRGEGCG